jgi:hypothetical protein
MLRLDTGLRLDAGLHLDASPAPVFPNPKSKKTRMTNLHVFFEFPFPERDVSFSRLLKFGARSLSRFSTNNPGNVFDARIAATTAALANTETGVTDVGVKEAVKRAKTQAKESFREGLPPQIRRIHGAVAGAFGDPSPELTECFPDGRSVYRECRDEELNNKLAQLVECITPRSAQVGATIVTLATNLKTQWLAIFSAQDTAMSDRELMADQRDTARAALELELFLNVLAVATEFPGNVAMCDYYFPQQYLRRPSAPTTPEPAVLTADPFDSVTRKSMLHGSANGAEQIRFERRMQGENDWSEIAVVDADEGSADFEDTLANNGTFEYRATGLRGAAEGESSAVLVVVAA